MPTRKPLKRGPSSVRAPTGIAKAVWTLEERVNNLIESAEKDRERIEAQDLALGQTIEALGAAVRTLASEVADIKRVIADHDRVNLLVEAINEKVAGLTRDVADASASIATLKKDVDDYREKRAEARGAAKLATWMKGAFIFLVSVFGIIAGYVIRAQQVASSLAP